MNEGILPDAPVGWILRYRTDLDILSKVGLTDADDQKRRAEWERINGLRRQHNQKIEDIIDDQVRKCKDLGTMLIGGYPNPLPEVVAKYLKDNTTRQERGTEYVTTYWASRAPIPALVETASRIAKLVGDLPTDGKYRKVPHTFSEFFPVTEDYLLHQYKPRRK